MTRVARPAPLLGPALAASIALAAHAARAQEAPPPPPAGSPQSLTELSAISVHPRTTTPVHFLSYRGDEQYVVHVQNQHCTTPCTLVLRSGPTSVHTTGSGELSTQLVVPHYTAQIRLFSGAPPAYFTAGAVLIPAGIVVATSFWAFGLACSSSGSGGGCRVANFTVWPVAGVAMLVAGSVLMGIANRAAPLDSNRVEILDARARPRVRFTDFAFGPTHEGVVGAATFTF